MSKARSTARTPSPLLVLMQNPSKPCVTRAYRCVRLMDKIIILRAAAQLGMTVKVTYSSQGEAFS
jgi:hypothetical protein